MKQYDLSTSSKWTNLADGNHSVTIIAKAAGYRDSASSTAVTVVKSGASETWVLNESLASSLTQVSFSANFSTGTNFNSDAYYDNIRWWDPSADYDDVNSYELDYYFHFGDTEAACHGLSGWTDEKYRTLTFETSPTGDLLTWLQANGTKQ